MTNTEKRKEIGRKTGKTRGGQEAPALDMEAFTRSIRHLLEEEYPFSEVFVQETVKNNNQKRTGISVRNNGCNVTPIVYLEDLYQYYLEGKPLDELCRMATGVYESWKPGRDMSIRRFSDFSAAKGRICYKLVNAEKNAGLLREVPHRLWHDLAVIYYILAEKEPGGIASFLIKNELAAHWHADEDSLYEAAVGNTPALFRGKILPMPEIMEHLSEKLPDGEMELAAGMENAGVPEAGLPLYVVSNDCHVNGAIAILYEGMLERFAGRVGGDFYILPSSVHETLLLPVLPFMEEKGLLGMVHTVNAGYVAPEEFLSDNVYRYHAEKGCVRVVGQAGIPA